jgi:ribosomal protein S6
MAVYEGMFILDPAKYSRDPAGSAQQINDLITQHGGSVLADCGTSGSLPTRSTATRRASTG